MSAASGFLDNAVTNVSLTFTGSADNATITLSDGLGGTATATGVNLAAASSTAANLTIAGGSNAGATFTLNLNSAGLSTTTVLDADVTYKVRGDFTSSRSASFDVRGTNTGAVGHSGD